MNRHPIPKRASLSLEPITTDVPKTSRKLEQSAQKSGCLGPVLLGLGIIFIVYLAWKMLLVPAYMNIIDSFAYGKARISETRADVGHGGQSTFLGLVENGQIVVIELVGEPPKHMVYAVGKTSTNDLVVTVSFQDVAGNSKMDMIVSYNGNEIVLYNDGHIFKATP